MKIHEKIKQIRKEKGLTLTVLEKRLIAIFGKKALRYNSLYRIENGLRDARVSSLSQLCIGLGISLKELLEGTEKEESKAVYLIRKKDETAHYIYSEKAKAQILSREKQPFLALKLMIQPFSQTRVERDPAELGKHEKWVYVLKGKLTCVIGEEKYAVKKDETLCLDSTIPHYFSNDTAQKTSCLIIQSPKHI